MKIDIQRLNSGFCRLFPMKNKVFFPLSLFINKSSISILFSHIFLQSKQKKAFKVLFMQKLVCLGFTRANGNQQNEKWEKSKCVKNKLESNCNNEHGLAKKEWETTREKLLQRTWHILKWMFICLNFFLFTMWFFLLKIVLLSYMNI